MAEGSGGRTNPGDTRVVSTPAGGLILGQTLDLTTDDVIASGANPSADPRVSVRVRPQGVRLMDTLTL